MKISNLRLFDTDAHIKGSWSLTKIYYRYCKQIYTVSPFFTIVGFIHSKCLTSIIAWCCCLKINYLSIKNVKKLKFGKVWNLKTLEIEKTLFLNLNLLTFATSLKEIAIHSLIRSYKLVKIYKPLTPKDS